MDYLHFEDEAEQITTKNLTGKDETPNSKKNTDDNLISDTATVDLLAKIIGEGVSMSTIDKVAGVGLVPEVEQEELAENSSGSAASVVEMSALTTNTTVAAVIPNTVDPSLINPPIEESDIHGVY